MTWHPPDPPQPLSRNPCPPSLCRALSSPLKFSIPSRKKVTPSSQILLLVFRLPSYSAWSHSHKAFVPRRNVTPSFEILSISSRSMLLLHQPYYPCLKPPLSPLNDCCALISGFLASIWESTTMSEGRNVDREGILSAPKIHKFKLTFAKILKTNAMAKDSPQPSFF